MSRAARWLVRFVAPVVLLCVAYGLQTIARAHPQAVEHYYSRALYPRIGRALSFTNKYVGFSVGEVLLFVALAGLLLLFMLQARRLYLRRVRLGGLMLAGFSCLLWLAGGMSLLFLLVWGLNFQRPSLAENTGLARVAASEEQLLLISGALIAGINRSYAEASAGASVGIAAPLDRAELHAIIEEAYRREPLLQGIGGAGGYGPPKPVYFSGLMSRLGIAGRYFPFTGEPEYNAAQPTFDLPHAIAHEMAHQRGFAREDEANFIAFLVCVNSSHPFVRYSGYLNALNAADALAASSPTHAREIFAALAAGPRADLRARAAFWAQYRGRIREVSHQVNDSYLRANDVAAGVGNYNEDVALIISYYLTRLPPAPLNE